MSKIIIFGTTQFSRIIAKHIEDENAGEIVAFCVNERFLEETELDSKKIVAFEKLRDLFDMNECSILNTLGYSKMNQTRSKVSYECLDMGYRLYSYISKNAKVYSKLTGFNNIVMPGAFIGYDVTAGNNNVFYSGCMLTHDITVGNNNFIAANSTFGGNVKIGNNCFIGLNATVKNQVTLADKTLVGAGAYVNFNTKEGNVVVPPRSTILEKTSEQFL